MLFEYLPRLQRASVLTCLEIEKRIIFLEYPFVSCWEHYGGDPVPSFSLEEIGISDFRYITKEEIENARRIGYDGIFLTGIECFIKFPKNM